MHATQLHAALTGLMFAALGQDVHAHTTKPATGSHGPVKSVQLGPRPYWLIDNMDDGWLKTKLNSCKEKRFKPTAFSIGHRGGGTMLIPEHTLESHLAGARMGAGILECDVTFTSDEELVCRHSQCDLHTTTNIVAVPSLNAKCTTPFKPANATAGTPATAKCCTSDITLAEYKSLCGKMDGANISATNPQDYLLGTPRYRSDLYSGECPTLLSHKESIQLIEGLGLQHTPELKVPEVTMPFRNGSFTQEKYAQKMIDAYRAAGVPPKRVWPQSFEYPDLLYWIRAEPEFARQAVFLDETGDTDDTFPYAVGNLTKRAAAGVKIVAPPLPYLVTIEKGKIVPSVYAKEAKRLGLEIITWTLERSGFLGDGSHGGYYYASIANATDNDGDVFNMVHVLAQDVGVLGIFSDWSATVTYYANCFGLFP